MKTHCYEVNFGSSKIPRAGVRVICYPMSWCSGYLFSHELALESCVNPETVEIQTVARDGFDNLLSLVVKA